MKCGWIVLLTSVLFFSLPAGAQTQTAEVKPAARLVEDAPIKAFDTTQIKFFAPFLKQFAADTSEQLLAMAYFPGLMERTYAHIWERDGKCWTSWYKDAFSERKAQQCGGDVNRELDTLLRHAPIGSFTIEARVPSVNNGTFIFCHQKGGRIWLNVYYASGDMHALSVAEKKSLKELLKVSDFMQKHKP